MQNGRPARWMFPQSLPEHLNTASLAERVLWNRGFRDRRQVREFLSPGISQLHEPFGLRDMDRAVERLCRAIRNAEPILLYGDYDVDGTTSVVVLKTVLKLAGANVDYHVPH